MRRKSVTILLVGCMIVSLAGGCTGNTGNGGKSGSSVELIDPVNAEVSYEQAEIKDLYNASVYAATVMPYIEEYSPVKGFNFGSMKAYPGEKVKKGQELIASDTSKYDEQIKNKKEEIASMEENHQKYLEKQNKLLKEQRREEEIWEKDKNNYEHEKPAEFIMGENGEQVENPAFASWSARMEDVTGRYRIAKHNADTIQLQIDQQTALYELDHKHQLYLLENLQKERREATITSGMDGEVVAIKMYERGNYVTSLYQGDWLAAETPVIAVGDMSRKIIKCDYINKTVIRNAEDVYVLVNGKRYEVEYQPISAEEYTRMTAAGQKIYSTFELVDADDEVSVGAYASIAVISSRVKDVVTVPKEAIHKDELGNFVYVVKDGQSVYTTVQTGYSDGNFTEIKSGLNAGDKVLYTGSQTAGTETAKLTRGEFHASFSERAMLTYPDSDALLNPVKNGTAYFTEMLVKNFQHVEKGDPIANIRVEADSIALARNETRLGRLTDRLADYKKKNEGKESEESYIETVKNYEEQIAEVQKAIKEQKADFAVKTIRADRTGVIVSLADLKSEDILQKDAQIASIADEGTCYVLVQDEKQNLQYGNEVSVIYEDNKGQKNTVTGRVASTSKMGVGNNLQSSYTFILLPEDKIGEMMESTMGADDYWGRYRYTVEAKLRAMDNVLLVPRRAVYDIGGKTYVYVKESDGSVSFRNFVPGGNNESYYWVVEGLTEGMEVCLK